VIDVEDKRYFVESDPNGEWIFVSPAPLPAGTAALRIGLLGAGGRGEREVQSYNLQIGEDAQPIPPPVLEPIPDEGLTTIPVLSGRAPIGMSIRIYARRQPTDALSLLAETVTAEDGRWSAQPTDPLAPGDYSVWVVLLDEEGRPVSRSAAQRMTIGESQL
jgi:hypothetical protein